jgi:hypothetical protein
MLSSGSSCITGICKSNHKGCSTTTLTMTLVVKHGRARGGCYYVKRKVKTKNDAYTEVKYNDQGLINSRPRV